MIARHKKDVLHMHVNTLGFYSSTAWQPTLLRTYLKISSETGQGSSEDVQVV